MTYETCPETTVQARVKVAIFDLDGTLLDTLDDLSAAVNQAMAHAGFPTRSRDEVRAFVGNGVERLIRLAVPEGTDEATIRTVLAYFKEQYAAGCRDKTAPYPGVSELLDDLRRRGIRVAVVSNKFDAAVADLCAHYFGDRVEVAVGERPTVRKKPAPDTVFEAMTRLGLSPEERQGVVYIGDSDVDIETARQAGIPCISVTWGFRDEEFLQNSGGKEFAHSVNELKNILTNHLKSNKPFIQDLHAHTYYSFCGQDTPESIVEAAIAGGLDLFGICDHNYGVGYARHSLFCATAEAGLDNYERTLRRYFDHMTLIRDKYADRIRVLRGIEICTIQDDTHKNYALPAGVDVSFFDYCLIENLDHPRSITGGDLFGFAQRCGTPMVGVAHTDLFAHMANLGVDPAVYLGRMAEENIFWELNVSYDSTHHYREHAYVADFFADPAKQRAVRESGVRLSVGFDGHRVGDYLPARVADFCRRVTALGIKLAFEA